MQFITNKPPSMIWRFLRVLTRCHVWYLLIISIFIPVCFELFGFPWGHNTKGISNKHVDMTILDVAGGMLRSFISKFCDNSFELTLQKRAQSIILSPSNLNDSTADSNSAANDCYNQIMYKLHDEALTICGISS